MEIGSKVKRATVAKRTSWIPISNVVFGGNEEKYVVNAVRSTWVSSLGEYIDRFESDFASFVGAEHAVSVSNGTCAILLALKALDVGPGDEVVAPSFTFAATVNAILHAGATPVLIDCMPDHWGMDPAEFEKAITPATKAVIPVHLYGHPCDMRSIMRIAQRHRVFVIEDAAEAHGAECTGRKVGTIGHIGCFSFYGNKIVTTGEGGLCVTDDRDLDGRMRKLRDHGMSKERRYWHEEIGYNFRLTNLNAAIGVAQMERIGDFLRRRSELAEMYEQRIREIPELRTYPESPHGTKIDWLFCAFVQPDAAVGRDALLAKLKEYQIDARPTFYPVHLMPPYQEVRRIGSLGHSVRFGLSGINLPLYPSLTEEDVEYIVDSMKEIFYRARKESHEA
jgi:perosamine synthetase